MTFHDILIRAKAGDHTAIIYLLDLYQPLLLRSSYINGILDEDLFQEQCLTLMKCIEKFNRMD